MYILICSSRFPVKTHDIFSFCFFDISKITIKTVCITYLSLKCKSNCLTIASETDCITEHHTFAIEGTGCPMNHDSW